MACALPLTTQTAVDGVEQGIKLGVLREDVGRDADAFLVGPVSAEAFREPDLPWFGYAENARVRSTGEALVAFLNCKLDEWR